MAIVRISDCAGPDRGHHYIKSQLEGKIFRKGGRTEELMLEAPPLGLGEGKLTEIIVASFVAAVKYKGESSEWDPKSQRNKPLSVPRSPIAVLDVPDAVRLYPGIALLFFEKNSVGSLPKFERDFSPYSPILTTYRGEHEIPADYGPATPPGLVVLPTFEGVDKRVALGDEQVMLLRPAFKRTILILTTKNGKLVADSDALLTAIFYGNLTLNQHPMFANVTELTVMDWAFRAMHLAAETTNASPESVKNAVYRPIVPPARLDSPWGGFVCKPSIFNPQQRIYFFYYKMDDLYESPEFPNGPSVEFVFAPYEPRETGNPEIDKVLGELKNVSELMKMRIV